MVCYIVPLAVAVITSIFWGSSEKGPSGWWLNLFLYGAALFGVVDHLWNGELLLISEQWHMDLLLGVTITATIFGGWGITLGLAKIRPSLAQRMGILSSEQEL